MERTNSLAIAIAPIEAMRSLIEDRKDLIVKIGNTYEISRPLALELWKLLVQEVMSRGGSIKEEPRVEYASQEMVVVSLRCTIRVGDAEITLSEMGEAYAREKGKEDTLARTAFTRAMKRLLERVAGEDFINQVIMKLFPNPQERREALATEKQKDFIRKLARDGRLTEDMLNQLKEEGVFPKDFVLGEAIKNNTLTYGQARVIIDKALGK